MLKSRKEIEQAINLLWEMYDDEQNAGNTDSAAGFAAQAFELLEKLPENTVYISSHH